MRPAQRVRQDDRTALGLLALGLIASITLGALSTGFHQMDDLAHFQIARWSWTYPRYLLDDWGRPGFTSLYFLPARLGLPFSRVFSALLTASSAWLAFRIAQKFQLRRPWLAIVFCYLQPLFLELSLTTLTETVLAFYLVAAVYLVCLHRWSASAAVLSLGLITRHEAVVLVPVWIWFAHQQRASLLRLSPLLAAPFLVNGLALWFEMPIAARRLIDAAPNTWYGHGGWLTMLARTIQTSGPAIVALAFAGLRPLWNSKPTRLVPLCIATYFLVQTAVRALGLFESGGYARFLVPISPLMAIAATAGWQRLTSPDARQTPSAATAIAFMFVALWLAMEVQIRRPESASSIQGFAPAVWTMRIVATMVVLIALIYRLTAAHTTAPQPRGLHVALALAAALAPLAIVRPLRLGASERLVRETMNWLESHGLSGRSIESAHPYVEFLAGLTPHPRRAGLKGRAAAAPVGAILVWDRQFAPGPQQELPLSDLERNSAWHLINSSSPLPGESQPYVRVFERIDANQP